MAKKYKCKLHKCGRKVANVVYGKDEAEGIMYCCVEHTSQAQALFEHPTVVAFTGQSSFDLAVAEYDRELMGGMGIITE